MSDFLARLAARHSTESAILPRRQSRFELSPANLSPATEVSTEVIEPSRGPHTASTAPDVASARAAAEPRDEQDATGAPATPQRRPHQADSQARSTEVAHRSRAEQLVLETLQAVRREATGETAPLHQPSPAFLRPAVPQPIAGAAESRDDTKQRQSRGDDVDTLREPAVVRVHIGRIEIRAIPAPVERPRSRSHASAEKPKPMSLDRYLTERDRA